MKLQTKDITLISIFVVVITICSWINIPGPVPFTLQTFAVFLSIILLGGFKGSISIIIYILLGIIGLPVFSGFKSGLSAILGLTGGYIIGFLIISLIYLIFEKRIKKRIIPTIIILIIGLLICYLFGTLWFIKVNGNKINIQNILSTLSICVFPFVIPDLIKLALAILFNKRVSKYIK